MKKPLALLMAFALAFQLATPVFAETGNASGTCGDNLTWTFSPNGALTISGSGDMSYDKIAPWYCYREQITSVTMKPGITSIGANAFSDCASLVSVEIPAGVTSIGGCTFYDCSSLTSVKIPNGVTSIGWYAFAGCDSLASVTIPKSVTSIDDGAFASCSSLNSVTIPAGVTSIGELTFEGCSSLTSIEIPVSVTSIGVAAFSDCSGLTKVTIPESVTSIGLSAFSGCDGLTSIEIPQSITEIGELAFSHCKRLRSIQVDSKNENYTSIDGVLFSKDGTRLLQYPDGKDGATCTILASVVSIDLWAFYGCGNLRDILVDDKNTSYTSVDGILFSKDGTQLLRYPVAKADATYVIPESVVSIGESAFLGCKNLTKVTMPESVTSIEDLAFYNCVNLSSVTIPASVTSIGIGLFEGCDKLKDVYYSGSESEWEPMAPAVSDDSVTIHYDATW